MDRAYQRFLIHHGRWEAACLVMGQETRGTGNGEGGAGGSTGAVEASLELGDRDGGGGMVGGGFASSRRLGIAGTEHATIGDRFSGLVFSFVGTETIVFRRVFFAWRCDSAFGFFSVHAHGEDTPYCLPTMTSRQLI
jgi:hypothetical protein